MKIDLPIESLGCDPVQYKPYSPIFKPEKLYLQVEVKDKDVLSNDEDGIVLNEDGFRTILKTIANAVEQAQVERQETRQKLYQGRN